MALYTINAQRFDPYHNFKFRLKWDNKYFLGASKVGALKRTTEVVKHRHGATEQQPEDARQDGVRGDHDRAIGVSHDIAGEQWANKVWSIGAGLGQEVSLKDFRKDITLEIYNESGQLALAYTIFRCWVSEFSIHELDANANAVLIQSMKLENEGWLRDVSVKEPTEPSFTIPSS